MSTPASKSDYMLLFRGTNWDKELSPEQLQKVVADWHAWFERLKQEGKCAGGHPLQNEGKLVSGKKGRTVADGPFAESKEFLVGYWIIDVDSEQRAWDLAAKASMAPGPGGTPLQLAIEVRQIMGAPPAGG